MSKQPTQPDKPVTLHRMTPQEMAIAFEKSPQGVAQRMEDVRHRTALHVAVLRLTAQIQSDGRDIAEMGKEEALASGYVKRRNENRRQLAEYLKEID